VEYHARVQDFAPHRRGGKYYANLDLTARQKLFDDLFKTTREFDAEFGTKLYDAMYNEMKKNKFFERTPIRRPE
jgi:hypothetical protein